MSITRDKNKSNRNQSLPVEWLDSSGCFIFGKYGGKVGHRQLASEVVKSDPSYIRWIIENIENMDEQDRSLLSMLLERYGR